jgi:exopolysaccharide biosynthesis predicted pyruvyltransferase EpsI
MLNEMFQIVNIRDYLKTRLSNNFLYFPNPGNAGDSLIGCATIQLFEELNLNYVLCNQLLRCNGKTLVYGGGGNLVPLYPYCKRFLEENKDNNNDIIILPQTIVGHEDLLQSLGKNVTIIARELKSYHHLLQHMQHKENIFIADDLALHINIKLLHIHPKIGKGTLNAFRLDKESTCTSIPEDNVDVSNKFSLGTSDMNIMTNVSIQFLSFINEYEIVHTDRLHVAIACVLLNKHVFIYDNSYSKCKMVYNYSLKKKYPLCIFVEDL